MTRRPAVLFLSPPTWLTGVGVTRTLADIGVAVHLLKHRGVSPARLSRYCRGTVAAGDNGRPSEDPARDLDDLLAAGRRLGVGTVLMPGTDEWAVFVAENSDRLAAVFTFQQPAPGLVGELASKIGMQRLARANGVATPGLFCPANATDAARLADSLAYPVFLKPVESRPDAWAKGVANDKAALLSQYRAMEESPEAPNVMFQEFIPGTDEDVWMFDGAFDRDSRCLLGITGQKLRQLPAHMGHCSLGICRQNQAVVDTAVGFLQALGYQGIVDMGFRFDRRTGEYNLLDVNPRIGGAFRLFVDTNGLDVAKALYLDLTNQEVHAGPPSEGRRWLKEDSDMVAFRQYRRLNEISLGSWLRSLRGVEEGATFSWRDPMPFVGTFAQLAGQTLGGRRERLWRAGRPQAVGRLLRQGPTGARRDPGRPPSPRVTISYDTGGLEQARVKRYFESGATFWDSVYEGSDVFARIHQHRLGAALAYVESLHLPAGTRCLDAGSGAGLAAIELARRGFMVDAVDPAQAMVDMLSTRVQRVNLEGPVSPHRGDVHSLDFDDARFKVAIALGVIPWLHSPELALRELSRVLEPGGWLIVNADNRSRLSRLLDPWSYPGIIWLRSRGKAALGGLSKRPMATPSPTARMHSRRQFDRMMAGAGLIKVDSTSFGYGPFTLLGRRILPRAIGLRVNSRLQDLSDGGLAPLRALGAQYLVLARKGPGP